MNVIIRTDFDTVDQISNDYLHRREVSGFVQLRP